MSERPTRDVLAEAMRRDVRGSKPPPWPDLTDDRRALWLARADCFIRILAEHGLTLTRTDKETP